MSKTIEKAHERALSELIHIGTLSELSGISPTKIYRQGIKKGTVLPVLKGTPMLFSRRQAAELKEKGSTTPTDEEFGFYFSASDAAEYLGVGFAAFRMQAYNYNNISYVLIYPANGGKGRSVFVRPELERVKEAGLMRQLGYSGPGRPSKSQPVRNELAEQIIGWMANSGKRKEIVTNIAKEFSRVPYGDVEAALAHLVAVKKVKEGQMGSYSVLK